MGNSVKYRNYFCWSITYQTIHLIYHNVFFEMLPSINIRFIEPDFSQFVIDILTFNIICTLIYLILSSSQEGIDT